MIHYDECIIQCNECYIHYTELYIYYDDCVFHYNESIIQYNECVNRYDSWSQGLDLRIERGRKGFRRSRISAKKRVLYCQNQIKDSGNKGLPYNINGMVLDFFGK